MHSHDILSIQHWLLAAGIASPPGKLVYPSEGGTPRGQIWQALIVFTPLTDPFGVGIYIYIYIAKNRKIYQKVGYFWGGTLAKDVFL